MGGGSVCRKRTALLLLTLLAVSSPAGAAGPAIAPISIALAVHDSIFIEGDAALTARNGVVGGDGSPENPFVIDGWDINITSNDGVVIRNTSAFLLIRSMRLHGDGEVPLHDGVYLFQARNVRIENVTAFGANAGVDIRSSDNVSVGRSILPRNDVGIRIFESTRVSAYENVVHADGWITYNAVYVRDSDRLSLQANDLALDTVGFGNDEVYIDNTTNVVLEDNVIGTNAWKPGFGTGVWLIDVMNATIRNNTFHSRGISPSPFAGGSWSSFDLGGEIFDSYTITPDNQIDGKPLIFRNRCQDLVLDRVVAGEIIVANCEGVRVSNITFQYGQVGLILANSTGASVMGNRFVQESLGLILWASGAEVYHNDFIHAGLAMSTAQESQDLIRFNGRYPRGGNYWWDAGGVDRCSGESQSFCPDSDGMLDDPYDLFGPDDPWVDRYPLARPINGTNFWPTARFRVDTPDSDVYVPFVFNATGVSDPEDDSGVLQVRWDFDGDGKWDTNWTTDKVVSHQYSQPGAHTVRLEVRDSGGLLAITSVTFEVKQFSGWRASAAILGIPALLLVSMLGAYFVVRRAHRKTRIRGPFPPASSPAVNEQTDSVEEPRPPP